MKCAIEPDTECAELQCPLYGHRHCPQWQEHQLRLKAVDLLIRVVGLVSVHLETEHEELYREIDEFLKGAQS